MHHVSSLDVDEVDTLTANCAEFGIEYFGMEDPRQGIVHIVGPEQGLCLFTSNETQNA